MSTAANSATIYVRGITFKMPPGQCIANGSMALDTQRGMVVLDFDWELQDRQKFGSAHGSMTLSQDQALQLIEQLTRCIRSAAIKTSAKDCGSSPTM